MAAVRALWAGETVAYRGGFWALEGATLAPRPTRRRLELWLGGRAEAALRRIGRIADGWLASFASPEQVGEGIATIRAAAAEAGRSIDADRYGGDDLQRAVRGGAAAGRRPAARPPAAGLERGDHVAVGAEATRELLERFLAVGATKFVLNPLARDPAAWLRELHPTAIEPLERAGVPTP